MLGAYPVSASSISSLLGFCCNCNQCPVTITCCPAGLPLVLHGTVANRSGSCSCIPATLVFTWDGTLYRSNEFLCDVGKMTFTLRCRAGAISCNGIGLTSEQCPTMGNVNPDSSCTCSNCNTIMLNYINVTPTGCCAGSFDVLVTV